MNDEEFQVELKKRTVAERLAMHKKLFVGLQPDDPEEYAAFLRGDDIEETK